MVETKDKAVTVESLLALHEHNKLSYMTKENPSGSGTLVIAGNGWFAEDVYVDGNKLIKTIDLGDAPLQYNPAVFTNFILEILNEENGELRHIVFTNKISNNSTLVTKAQAFQFDSDGNMQLYKLEFYWRGDGYMVDSTVSTFAVATGDKTTSGFAYTKIYGVQYI